jgi:hypothetical protein
MFYRAYGHTMIVAEYGTERGIDNISPGCFNKSMIRFDVITYEADTAVRWGRVQVHRDLVPTV